MDDSIDLLLLDRYFAGRCTAAEQQRLADWIAADPARSVEVEMYRRLVADIKRVGVEVSNTDTFWQRLSKQLARATGTRRALNAWPDAKSARGGWYVTALAASVVVALGVGLVRAAREWPLSWGSREYATAAAQRSTITLNDGTRLILAPASRVRVAARFGEADRPRAVELEGEAYFAVVHDAARPFTVHAGNAITRDVGTAFDIRAFPEDAGVRIAVTDGAVAVRVLAQEVDHDRPLHAGDMAVVTDTGIAVTHDPDISAVTEWTSGRLAFHDVPAGAMLQEIGRWYDLDFQLADAAMAAHRITTSWTDAPTSQMLTELGVLLGVRVDRHGRTVILTAHSGEAR